MVSYEIKVPNQDSVHYEHKWTKCIFSKKKEKEKRFDLGASGFSL